MTDRKPLLVRCQPCGHVWPALWAPMEASRAARVMKAASAACPACGNGKGLLMASKDDAALWANGPRSEPCFVTGDTKP